ncbi:MAG TPA: ABC transporter ATP-binding protein [Vicinamibacterales bacterium]|nr:ABC transporter ATP-binding protein [Vicinamibacterales bacterium]
MRTQPDLSHARPRPEAQVASGRGGLELRGLTKIFGDVVAVDAVDFHVDHGEYIVLLGPSGCGKTTILRMIGGHESATSGDILLDRDRLNAVPAAKRPTTTVFQHFALFPHMNVLGNVEFGLQMQRIGRKERRERAIEMIELVGLRELRYRRPLELSGGQQQRVALARVLVTNPKLLLLDEPFGDLDRLLQLRMRVELRELQRELGITFIHVTHNQEEALSMADRIVVMEAGRVMQVGSPVEITQSPKNLFVATFMGDNNIFRGAVSGFEAGQMLVATEIGMLALPLAAAAATPPLGEPVVAAVRANAIRVSRAEHGPPVANEMRCIVKATEYLGDVVKVHLLAGEHPLLAKAPEDQYLELRGLTGTLVAARFEPVDAKLLDE